MSFNSLSSKKVKHLIRGRTLFYVRPDQSVTECAQLMREKNVGALAVMEGALLKGIVSERDVVQRCIGVDGCDPATMPVSRIMSWPPVTIDRNMTMGVAVVMMLERNIRHLPVTNGSRVLGMISIRQLVEEFRSGLETSFLRIAV